MQVYMNSAGYKYAAESAKSPADMKLPFAKPELIALLDGENPMPPEMVDHMMLRENDTPGFIRELKEAAIAETANNPAVG